MEHSHSSSSLPKITNPSDLLNSSWEFFKKHWQVLVPVVIFPSIVSFVADLLSLITVHPIILIPQFILIVTSVILSVAMVPVAIKTIHDIKTNHTSVKTRTVIDSYKIGFKYFWWFILFGIINSLVNLGGTFLFVIPGIIMNIYGVFYMYSYVVDDKKGLSAFTESYSLVYRRWWPVFGRILFLSLVSMALWFLSMIASNILILLVNDAADPLISRLIGLVVTSILLPITFTYSYSMYHSLKEHRIHHVSVSGYKNWLVTFLVIGIIVVPTLFFGAYKAVQLAVPKIQETIQSQKFQEFIREAAQDETNPQVINLLKKFEIPNDQKVTQ